MKVDKDELLKLMQAGKTDRELAESFHVTRQAINLFRQQFKKASQLQQTSQPSVKSFTVVPNVRPSDRALYYGLDDMQKALVKTIHQAVEAEKLAELNWKLQNVNKAQEGEINRLKEENNKLRQAHLAYQQGELPSTLLKGK